MGRWLLLFIHFFREFFLLLFLFVVVVIVEDGFVAARLGDLHGELP